VRYADGGPTIQIPMACKQATPQAKICYQIITWKQEGKISNYFITTKIIAGGIF